MELYLHRRWKKAGYTVGELTLGGVVLCNTLEDTDRGLACTMSAAEIKRAKVYGQTAIPTGRYRLAFTYSQTFGSRSWAKPYGGRVPLLEGVKGFDGIRIHPGNTAADTLGCVLLGKNTEKGKVTQSQMTYKEILDGYLLPTWKRGESIFLTI